MRGYATRHRATPVSLIAFRSTPPASDPFDPPFLLPHLPEAGHGAVMQVLAESRLPPSLPPSPRLPPSKGVGLF